MSCTDVRTLTGCYEILHTLCFLSSSGGGRHQKALLSAPSFLYQTIDKIGLTVLTSRALHYQYILPQMIGFEILTTHRDDNCVPVSPSWELKQALFIPAPDTTYREYGAKESQTPRNVSITNRDGWIPADDVREGTA